MGPIVIFFVMGIVLMAISASLDPAEHLPGKIVCGVFAGVVFLLLVFIGAPLELGYGHVSNEVENFSERLEVGVVYELVGTTTTIPPVVSVRKCGIVEVLVVRGEKAPPGHFTMVDGKPAAMADCKK